MITCLLLCDSVSPPFSTELRVSLFVSLSFPLYPSDCGESHIGLVKVNDRMSMKMAQIVRRKEYLEVQHAQQILLIEQLHDGWNRIGGEDLANDHDRCHDLGAGSCSNFLNVIYHSDVFS